jgi:hypothetical protein
MIREYFREMGTDIFGKRDPINMGFAVLLSPLYLFLGLIGLLFNRIIFGRKEK